MFWKFFSGWWFQIFFIFTPIWGRFPCWLIFFKGVETTNQFLFFYLPGDFLALTDFKCDLGTFPNIRMSLMVSQDAEQISWRGQAGVSGYQSPALKRWADSEGLLFWMLSQKQRTSQSLWMFDNFDRTFWGNSLRTDTLKLLGSSFREPFFWATSRLSQSTLPLYWPLEETTKKGTQRRLPQLQGLCHLQ